MDDSKQTPITDDRYVSDFQQRSPLSHRVPTRSINKDCPRLTRFITRANKTTNQIRAYVLRSGPARYYSFHSLEAENKEKGRFSGWRGGILAATIAVACCICIEVGLLVAAFHDYFPVNGTARVFHGSCDNSNNLTTVLLLPFNVIGTVVIASSNYLLQCLLAPTRREVDKVHANGQFVHVGVPSWKNMRYVRKSKTICSIILIISTIPVHLLLNSVVFMAVSANNYGVLLVSSDFLEDPSWDNCSTLAKSAQDEFGYKNDSITTPLSHLTLDWACRMRESAKQHKTMSGSGSNFTILDAHACITRYSDPLSATAGNVILVTNSTNLNWATISNGTDGQPLTILPEAYNDNLHTPPSELEFIYSPEKGNGKWQQTHFLGRSCSNPLKCMIPDSIYSPSLNVFDGRALDLNGYATVTDVAWNISSFRSVWNAFDYQYWLVGQKSYWKLSANEYSLSNKWQPSSWLCDADYIRQGGQCTLDAALQNFSDWRVTPNRIPISYCISETVSPQCEVQYSSVILITIIVFDAIKMAILLFGLYVAFDANTVDSVRDQPLATVGDAVASFLQYPDPTTRGQCLTDKELVLRHHKAYHNIARRMKINGNKMFPRSSHAKSKMSLPLFSPLPLVWLPRSRPWRSVPSRGRWIFFGVFYSIAFTAALIIFITCIRQLTRNNALTQWTAFSGLNPRSLFANTNNGPSAGLDYAGAEEGRPRPIDLRTIVQINFPQIVFSSLYFIYNALFTSMMAAREWGKFATTPKGKALRVTDPSGLQRSTYWLSLPWMISLPLMAVSALMHWLLSRAVFLVRINVYNFDQVREAARDITGIGYSTLAIVLVMTVLVIMLAVLLVVGQQQLPAGIPVVGTNSRAISAACHDVKYPNHEDGDEEILSREDAALGPLRWGVTCQGAGTEEKPGHCSLTGGEVQKPIEGHIYA